MRLSELITETKDVQPPDDPPLDGQCRACGLDGPGYPVSGSKGVFSNAFTSSAVLQHGDHICWRCKHLADWMEFRRYHWIASREGVEIIKKRPVLIDHLLDPPQGPWMAKYNDGSEFLYTLNGWLYGQQTNTSRDRYRLLVDKRPVAIDRERLAEMIAFGRDLRGREHPPAKQTLKQGVTPGDLARYDLSRDDYQRINDDLVGREDWRIAVQLIQ